MTIRPNNFGTVGTHPSQHTHIQPATTFTEMSLVTVGGGEGKILADSKDQFSWDYITMCIAITP